MAKKRTTKKQLNILLNYIENNPEILQPSKNQQEKCLKWEELKNLLNAEDGPQKNVKEWKNVFNDLKTNCRRKARLLRCDITGTGGGTPKIKALTPVEKKLMQIIINPVVVDGMPSVLKTGIADAEDSFDIEGMDVVLGTNEAGEQFFPHTTTDVLGSSTDTLERPSVVLNNNIFGESTDGVPSEVLPSTSQLVPRTQKIHSRQNKKNNRRGQQHRLKHRENHILQLMHSNNNIARAINNVAKAIRELSKKIK